MDGDQYLVLKCLGKESGKQVCLGLIEDAMEYKHGNDSSFPIHINGELKEHAFRVAKRCLDYIPEHFNCYASKISDDDEKTFHLQCVKGHSDAIEEYLARDICEEVVISMLKKSKEHRKR